MCLIIFDRLRKWFGLTKLSLLLFLLLWKSSAVLAQGLEALPQDFAPLFAVVVKVNGQAVILDKGRRDGVHAGDLFTIYKRTQKILNPLTKEVIGYQKKPVALVEVRRIDESFSTALVLTQQAEFVPGAPAVRYSDIKALLLAEPSSAGKELYSYLTHQLANISFIKDFQTRFADLEITDLAEKNIYLVFVQEGRYLRVYNRRLDLVQVYDITPLLGRSLSRASSPTQALRNTSPPATGSGAYPYSTLNYQRPAPPVFRRVARLSRVVVNLEMADLDQDHRPEIVYLTPEGLFITRYKGRESWSYPYKGFGKLLNVSVGPHGYLALNIFVDKVGMRSRLLRFTPGGIETIAKDIHLILGFFDTDGDGIKETFLGQAYDEATFFGHPVYRLLPTPNGLQRAGRFEAPYAFRILGSAIVDLNGDGIPEIVTQNLGHKLEIYQGRRKIWSSSLKVGGSLYTIQATVQGSTRVPPITVSAEVSPVVVSTEGRARKELLVVSNHSSHRDLLPGVPSYAGGQVLLLAYSPLGYALRPLSGVFEGALQGLGVYQQEVFVTVVKGNPFTQKGESFLLAFPFKSLSAGR